MTNKEMLLELLKECCIKRPYSLMFNLQNEKINFDYEMYNQFRSNSQTYSYEVFRKDVKKFVSDLAKVSLENIDEKFYFTERELHSGTNAFMFEKEPPLLIHTFRSGIRIQLVGNSMEYKNFWGIMKTKHNYDYDKFDELTATIKKKVEDNEFSSGTSIYHNWNNNHEITISTFQYALSFGDIVEQISIEEYNEAMKLLENGKITYSAKELKERLKEMKST